MTGDHDPWVPDLDADDPNDGAPGCTHPPGARRSEGGGVQVCTACGDLLVPERGLDGMPDPRDELDDPLPPPGSHDAPGSASPDSGGGVLNHIPWGDGARPYTPEDVEHEIIDTLARIEGGARYQAAREREAHDAEIAYQLALARATLAADGKTVKHREAQALLAVEDLWLAHKQAQQIVKTTAAGMHTLRSKLSGLQSINRSVSSSSGGR